MALKETIETWHLACCLLDDMQFQRAAKTLSTIENPSAKIIHNLGCLLMLQKLFSDAAQTFKLSIEKDKHLALSYFTRGLSYYHLGSFAEAEADFNSAKALIKGDDINYKQLGAPIVLATRTVEQFLAATKESSTNKVKGLPPVSITDCVFRPPKKMVDNLPKHDFLGKSKVVSSSEDRDIKSGPVQSAGTQQSLSLPSSPVTSRNRSSPVMGKKNIPAPPTRPPPRLRKELTPQQSNAASPKNPRPACHEYEDVIQSNNNNAQTTVYSLAKVFSSQVTPNGTHSTAAGGPSSLTPSQRQKQLKSPSVGPYSVTVLQQHPTGSARLHGGPLSPPPPIPDAVTSKYVKHASDLTPYKVTNLNLSAPGPINAGPTGPGVSTTWHNSSTSPKPVPTASNQALKKPMRPPPPRSENKS